jgi:hypothetical protein
MLPDVPTSGYNECFSEANMWSAHPIAFINNLPDYSKKLRSSGILITPSFSLGIDKKK